jgi:ATP-dependent DNA ligase
VAYLDGRGGLRLRSRNYLDVTGSYPELASLAGVDQPVVLDGEIVALDTSGAPSFGRLQRRTVNCTRCPPRAKCSRPWASPIAKSWTSPHR